MTNTIDDEMLEYVSILAKLELKGEEKEKARTDMEKMLEYVSVLGELDTEGTEPLVQTIDLQNVFREDEITNGNDRENILKNAPATKDGHYKVPRTF